MASRYEIWHCDDAGRRLHLLEKVAGFSYNRTTQGLGTIQVELPFYEWIRYTPTIFTPDNRLDVWRSPQEGIAARREGSFLLRRFQVYQRRSDSMLMIILYARSPIDILRRQYWETDAVQTNELDDMMKNVVRGMFVNNPSATSTAPTRLNGGVYTYTGEFAVDSDSSDGPVQSSSFYLHNVFDICHDLRVASWTASLISSANHKIYFDVVDDESIGLPGGFGYRFRTFPDYRGKNRTGGIIFSIENGNLIEPTYYEDYQDEITGTYLYNLSGNVLASAQSSDQYLSRWNFIKRDVATAQSNANAALTDAYTDLKVNGVDKAMNATFLNSPGSDKQPRSLYGLDWDLGDLLPVKFATKALQVEVAIVYVSVNDQGVENCIGKSLIGTA